MTLPTIAYLLQEFFDGRDDRRMPYPDSRQTFGIGQPGQLVQISGDALESVSYTHLDVYKRQLKNQVSG